MPPQHAAQPAMLRPHRCVHAAPHLRGSIMTESHGTELRKPINKNEPVRQWPRCACIAPPSRIVPDIPTLVCEPSRGRCRASLTGRPACTEPMLVLDDVAVRGSGPAPWRDVAGAALLVEVQYYDMTGGRLRAAAAPRRGVLSSQRRPRTQLHPIATESDLCSADLDCQLGCRRLDDGSFNTLAACQFPRGEIVDFGPIPPPPVAV